MADWREIEELAKALLERKTLSGEEVKRMLRASRKAQRMEAAASGDLRIVLISRFENRRRTAIFFTLLASKYLLPPFFFWNQGEAHRRLTGILPRIHRFSNRPISTIFTPPLAAAAQHRSDY